jgi:hypothetical protein
VSGGIVALAAQDVDELDAGFVEAASLADALEAAVEFDRSGAVPVASNRRGLGSDEAATVVSASTARVAWKYWSATFSSEMR